MNLLMGLYTKFSLYITTALILAIGVLWYFNGSYKDRIKELAMEAIVSEVNIITLNASIDKQNKAIEDNKIEYLKKEKEYKQKEKIIIKYKDKIIYKNVNIRRDNCEDIKQTITNIKKDYFKN